MKQNGIALGKKLLDTYLYSKEHESLNTKWNQDFSLLNGFSLIFFILIAIVLYFNILYHIILKVKICNICI